MRASLRATYGIDLRAQWGVGSASDLADLTVWLPPGCALWMDIGGPAAVSAETRQLQWVVYRLEVLAWLKSKDAKDGRNRPKPPADPKWAHERRAEDATENRRAAAYLARQRRSQIRDS